MASGSFNISTDNGYIVGKLSWETTDYPDSNQSKVSCEMRLWRTNDYETWGNGDFFITIDGTKTPVNKDFSISLNSNTLIMSASKTITHNGDGSKTIPIAWGGLTNVFDIYDSSDSAKLTTYPRGRMNVKAGTTWKNGQAYVKVSGVWKKATGVFVKVNGVWKRST